MKNLFLTFLILLGCAIVLSGQKNFKAEEFTCRDGSILMYQKMEPRKIKKSKKYPLVVFLHGAGERGADNKSQLVHGAKLFDDKKNRRKYPAFVLFPQCPSNEYWAKVDIDRSDKEDPFRFDFRDKPNKPLESVFELIRSYLRLPSVDPDRVYIMGLSMGGMGTFEAISRHPEWFAAAIPICGGGDLEFVESFAQKVPVWVFHGAKDDVVLPKYSRDIVQEIIFKGGFPRYSEYSEANHNAWDKAFAEKDLLPWLFHQKKTLTN